jgi:hypothetical protein
MALLLILAIRNIMEAAFADWAWRVPFLLSIVHFPAYEGGGTNL